MPRNAEASGFEMPRVIAARAPERLAYSSNIGMRSPWIVSKRRRSPSRSSSTTMVSQLVRPSRSATARALPLGSTLRSNATIARPAPLRPARERIIAASASVAGRELPRVAGNTAQISTRAGSPGVTPTRLLAVVVTREIGSSTCAPVPRSRARDFREIVSSLCTSFCPRVPLLAVLTGIASQIA